ncbi:hypothetical protein OPV22_026122 [Ensete ventricosum]|uniref:Uncharacterized protein n=1 Tax=Ensete ventricosum TaxID=4639 RepID=A0AAV8Q5M0_ENSVE|nr:hypothetical protein OPV22_026122 [Ensete ventricosum]
MEPRPQSRSIDCFVTLRSCLAGFRGSLMFWPSFRPLDLFYVETGLLRKASDLSYKHTHVPERLTGYTERNSQACQRISTDKLGKVVGSVMMFDKRSVKVAYDSRQLSPNAVHPP